MFDVRQNTTTNPVFHRANDSAPVIFTRELAIGTNTFTWLAEDLAGNEGVLCTTEVTRVLPISVPTARLSPLSDTGISSFDNLSKDDTLTIVGLAEPESFVDVISGNSTVGTTIADEHGKWSADTTALPEGPNTFVARSTSKDGAMVTTSSQFEVTVDLTEPTTIASNFGLNDSDCALAPASDTGVSDADGITDVSTATLRGGFILSEDAFVSLFDVRQNTTTNPVFHKANDSAPVIFTRELAMGTNTFTWLAEDLAGNEGVLCTTEVTRVASPSAPTMELSSLSDTGLYDDDRVTSVSTEGMLIEGTADMGASHVVLSYQLVNQIPSIVGTSSITEFGEWSVLAFNGTKLSSDVFVFDARAVTSEGFESQPTTLIVKNDVDPPTRFSDASCLVSFTVDDGILGDRLTSIPLHTDNRTVELTYNFTAIETLAEVRIDTLPQRLPFSGPIPPFVPRPYVVDTTLFAGINLVNITAVDIAGNEAPNFCDDDSLQITAVSLEPPTIVLDPASDSGFNNTDLRTRFPTITVNGVVEQPFGEVVIQRSISGFLLREVGRSQIESHTYSLEVDADLRNSLPGGSFEVQFEAKVEVGGFSTPSSPQLSVFTNFVPPARPFGATCKVTSLLDLPSPDGCVFSLNVGGINNIQLNPGTLHYQVQIHFPPKHSMNLSPSLRALTYDNTLTDVIPTEASNFTTVDMDFVGPTSWCDALGPDMPEPNSTNVLLFLFNVEGLERIAPREALPGEDCPNRGFPISCEIALSRKKRSLVDPNPQVLEASVETTTGLSMSIPSTEQPETLIESLSGGSTQSLATSSNNSVSSAASSTVANFALLFMFANLCLALYNRLGGSTQCSSTLFNPKRHRKTSSRTDNRATSTSMTKDSSTHKHQSPLLFTAKRVHQPNSHANANDRRSLSTIKNSVIGSNSQ